MKKRPVVFSVLFALVAICANASDSCKILLNKNLVFEGAVEQENPVAVVKTNQKTADGYFTIKYRSENADSGWKRTIYIDDKNGDEIKKLEMPKQAGSVCVKASVLKRWIDKRQPLFIYTLSLPKDPLLADRVRVRSVLICKIEWH
jgi:hypothetical protein